MAGAGHTVAYTYDNAGRLTHVALDGADPAVYTYDPGDRRTRLALPNGVQTDYTFDANDRLTNLATTKGAATLASFAYTRDPVGNPTQIALANGETLHYQYDNAYRLTHETRKDPQQAVLFDQTFTYDAVGNRTQTVKDGITTTSVYNNANQLVTATTGNTVKTYTHDANGNQTLVETRVNDVLTASEQTWYDPLNRRLRWRRDAGGQITEESFTYRGAAWHRRSQTADGTTTTFLYDGDDVAADFIGGGLDTFYVTPFLDENLSVTRGVATHYYTHDGLGSVRTVTDSSGLLVNRYAYTAFGEPYVPGTSVVLPQRTTYTGREANPLSDTMFYRPRPYSPSLGMMLNRNPWGYIHRNPSLYDAMDQNPVTYTEPFSLSGWWERLFPTRWEGKPKRRKSLADKLVERAQRALRERIDSAEEAANEVKALAEALHNPEARRRLVETLGDKRVGKLQQLVRGMDQPIGLRRQQDSTKKVIEAGCILIAITAFDSDEENQHNQDAQQPQNHKLRGPERARSAPDLLELPPGKTRTTEQTRQARGFFKDNKGAARKRWEERTGKQWPLDPKTGRPKWASHPRAIKDGGGPLRVEPGKGDDPNAEHNVAKPPDGKTDHQRWGAMGPPARKDRQGGK